MSGVSKQFKEVLNAAEAQGWRLERSSKAYRLLAPDGKNLVTVSPHLVELGGEGPSVKRALMNVVTQMRHAGFQTGTTPPATPEEKEDTPVAEKLTIIDPATKDDLRVASDAITTLDALLTELSDVFMEERRKNRDEFEKINKRLDALVHSLSGLDTLERRVMTANQKVVNDLRAEVAAAIKKANERVDPVSALRARLKES